MCLFPPDFERTKGFYCIVAVDSKNGIAKDGVIPWKSRADMEYFARKTQDAPEYLVDRANGNMKYPAYNIVVMGRNTWESIPDKFKPLKGRINVIISTTLTNDDVKKYNSPSTMNFNGYDATRDSNFSRCFVEKSFEDFVKTISFGFQGYDSYMEYCYNDVYVIGGKGLYETAAKHRLYCGSYVSHFEHDYDCDLTLNLDLLTRSTKQTSSVYGSVTDDYLKKSKLEREGKGDTYVPTPDNLKFVTHFYKSIKNHDEEGYVNLLSGLTFGAKRLQDSNLLRSTRNGKTHSTFGSHLEFDCRSSLPVLTTKKMFWRGIVEELLFFLRGDTDSTKLSEKGIRIWDGNTTREFLDNRGLTEYEVGDMGPMYGFNFRHFGAEYKGKNHDYSGQGTDQFADVLRLLKEDPTSRRIMMTAYDPSTVSQAVLPPCHSMVVQFYVDTNNLLHEHMYQRSVDSFLGLPFNITQHALLLYLVAHVSGYKPGKLHMSFGDVHLYENHIDAAFKQINRRPHLFPQLKMSKELSPEASVEEKLKYLETLEFSDFNLEGYVSHPGIKAEMNA